MGTTTPLFTLLLAGLGKLGIEPTSSARVIGLSSDTLSTFLIYRHTRWALSSSGWGIFAATCYATSSVPVTWAMSGMETPFFTLFVLLALGCLPLNWVVRRGSRATICTMEHIPG